MNNNFSQIKNFQENFQKSILDEKSQLNGIISSHGFGWEVYQQAYFLRHEENFINSFPTVKKVFGIKKFKKIIRNFVQKYPSQSPCIDEMIHKFMEIIQKQYSKNTLIYQSTRFDYLQYKLFFCDNCELLSLEQLTNKDPLQWGSIKLQLHPQIQWVKFNWDVPTDTIKKFKPIKDTEHWIFWRGIDLNVNWRKASNLEVFLLKKIKLGITFETFCAILSKKVGIKKSPMLSASYLKQWVMDGLLLE